VNLLNGSSITLGNMAGAPAVLTLESSTVTLDASSITTVADDAEGIIADQNSIIEVLNGSSIVTSGSNADGIFAAGSSMVTLDNSSITTNGNIADGIFAQNFSIVNVLDGSSIVTSGDDADGILARGSSTVKVEDSTIDASVGIGISAETFLMGDMLRVQILNNEITSGLASIVLNNGAGGTLTVFGAADATDLENQNTLNNGVFETGTILYEPMMTLP
jgi:hypothetical protein